jgi:hypothetical protein
MVAKNITQILRNRKRNYYYQTPFSKRPKVEEQRCKIDNDMTVIIYQTRQIQEEINPDILSNETLELTKTIEIQFYVLRFI